MARQKKPVHRVEMTEGKRNIILCCLDIVLILSILVDTFLPRISLTMLPAPNLHNTSCVLS